MEKSRTILWITNMMPGFVANRLGISGTNKEGWIEGAAGRICQEEDIKLVVAFPYRENGKLHYSGTDMEFYGFIEDTNHPEIYDEALVQNIGNILDNVNPDVIHIFGTEFPHTKAVMNIEKWRDKALIHIQGVMGECAKVYSGNIPDKVLKRKTFRDILKKDSIESQIEKYRLRAENERAALLNAKHILGRTEFDRNYVEVLNDKVIYHHVNETLRSSFYNAQWDISKCNRHELFLSQGNYPLKGAHKVIEAVALLKEKYNDIKLYIAGDKITAYKTIKDKIKISSYGRYLYDLVKINNLSENVIFTGTLTEEEMLKRFMSAEVFITASFVENSPNSLGEAMLMGMATISSNVGGIPSLVQDGEESLLYSPDDEKNLAKLIDQVFSDDELKLSLGRKARKRALVTHDKESNYEALLEAYNSIN